jgi:hypothetical protein
MNQLITYHSPTPSEHSMDRPFLDVDIGRLEDIFISHRSKRLVLAQLREELGFRRSKRAKQLQTEVNGALGGLVPIPHSRDAQFELLDSKSEKRSRVKSKRPSKGTTLPGYVNRNNQRVLEATNKKGTDHGQYIYVLYCLRCTNIYGANGSDIFQRKCPKCQQGAAGLKFT